MMKPIWRGIVAAFLAATPASANDWDAFAEPGAVAIMRHALAPGTSDPSGFRIDDCTTQRNLDDRGRAQARAIGDALRSRGIAFDRVRASQWCRSFETAVLLDIGEVTPLPALNSFFDNRSAGPGQTEDLRAYLRDLPEGTAVMLVTHQVNITALTGRGTSSGEIVIFRLEDTGEVTVLGEVLIPAR